jgi:ABC-type glutathione transport system ATPase component
MQEKAFRLCLFSIIKYLKMEISPIIKIEKLVKKFPVGKGEFTALNGIELLFTRGEFAGLVGPSGSGKTTLLNIVGSLDVPTSGEAVVLVVHRYSYCKGGGEAPEGKSWFYFSELQPSGCSHCF